MIEAGGPVVTRVFAGRGPSAPRERAGRSASSKTSTSFGSSTPRDLAIPDAREMDDPGRVDAEAGSADPAEPVDEIRE